MLSASTELARNALDAAPDAMVIIEDDGSIRFANRAVSALFGYSHDDLIGLSVEQLMPERFRNRHMGHRLEYVKASRRRPMGQGLTLFGQRQDGSEFPVEISLSPIQDAGHMLVAAAIRDVTDRKRAQDELTLARETAERAREVANQAREYADRANHAKSRFLATASHDLRQPLQTLALLNGALRRIIIHENAEEVLSQQEQAIGAMSRLLNALLDISKLESGGVKPEFADFSVAKLFEGLRDEFASIAAHKGVALEVEPTEEYAHSDAGLVEQILKNLFSNAIKYTSQGRVVARCSRENDSIRIEVSDTGIGIPADQIAYIYDEFYQVGVPTRSSRDGYGLGLSIVRRLVSLLDARLEVTSDVGRGSVFSLMLPGGRSQSASTTRERAATRPAALQTANPRVLLVEDDPGVRDATRLLLAVEGYCVTAVSARSEALRHVQEEGSPDLLITDYHLAEGELGTQVIAALREIAGTGLRAVLVTGDTSTLIKEMSGDRHLRIASKPTNAEELLRILTELLATG
jgi:PAS domain S-box-containing protein